MAAGNVQSFVNDVENMCECYICCVEYDENKHVPRVLPCQHTFCTDCLSKHCKGQKLKCPLCNQEHFTKNGNVKVFHKDNTRRDLKELLGRFMKTLCGVCKRHDHTRYFCITCNIRMCRSCYKEKKSNDCRKHNFEIPEDSSLTPDTSLELKDKQAQHICLLSGHEHTELKYYCAEKQCCKPVCSYCIMEVHKGHAYKPIENEYENRKKSMQSICQATSMKICRAKKLLENVEKETASLTESHTKGRENLTVEANRGIQYINTYKENAEKKVDDTWQMYYPMPREIFEMKLPIMELNERINKMISDEEVDEQPELAQ
ncbi:E3 ubiquitin-protein ligase TRIM45-like, partial [Saccostrea cucullata]|uniref:E3 ubiquitin-protein ligase TRIM45-like n=1 Tax=Saccostrea cuccullata TaxID=36930 RepID=UPI002ED5C783